MLFCLISASVLATTRWFRCCWRRASMGLSAGASSRPEFRWSPCWRIRPRGSKKFWYESFWVIFVIQNFAHTRIKKLNSGAAKTSFYCCSGKLSRINDSTSCKKWYYFFSSYWFFIIWEYLYKASYSCLVLSLWRYIRWAILNLQQLAILLLLSLWLKFQVW